MNRPDPYDPGADLFGAIDFGWANPNVFLWIQPDRKCERVIVLGGLYQTHRTPEENARLALAQHNAFGFSPLTGGYGDPSNPAGLASYSQVFGVEFRGPQSRVERGHELVREWLKMSRDTKGAAGLLFSRLCPSILLKEMSQYEKHEPGKGAHHGCDCLRYFFAGWLG
jgi:hypothetical protein